LKKSGSSFGGRSNFWGEHNICTQLRTYYLDCYPSDNQVFRSNEISPYLSLGAQNLLSVVKPISTK
jgi:hypothetical protein